LNQNISKSNHYPFKIQQQNISTIQQHTIHQQQSYFDTSTANASLVNLRIPLQELNILGSLVKTTVTARVKMPSGKVSNPNVEQNPDGTVSIKYQPSEIGLHELDVYYNGQPIQGSPFKFHVDAINSITDSFISVSSSGGYVTAYGPGLSHGVCGRPCEFRIVTKDAGTGGLAVAVEGPSKAEIQCRDNKNGTCDVIYYPTAPGDYTITIKFAEKNIGGSPFIAKITGDSNKRNQVLLGNQSDISLKVIEGDVNDLHATIRSPSGQEEPCLLKKLSNGSLGMIFFCLNHRQSLL
jgi:filamin